MDKDTRKKLRELLNAVIEQAEQDEVFANKLTDILKGEVCKSEKRNNESKRGANRRDKAVLDPIRLIEEGDMELRQKLEMLTEKELKDIIADFGMDPSKLAMKWKDRERIINHIIDTAERRASKGDAFRDKGGDA